MKSSPWRRALPWLWLLAVGVGAATLRFRLIESSVIGQFCSSHDPWWCNVRFALVLGFLHNVYGVAALIAAALALVSRRRALAWLAAAVGLFAVQLYCVEAGALALLIGSLRLLRLQANARRTPVEQHRQGQQQVQSQP
ncbi:MAG TPA: hypothetical protein VFE77_18350 [Rhodanobacter sp.]|nr:hypothetical protein [Rhodanobacter sp.]